MRLSYFQLIVVALACLIINVEGYNECRTECNGRCRANHCNRNEQESTNPDCVNECDDRNHRLCCVPDVDERKCEDECNGHCRAHKCNKGETLSSNPFCMKDCNGRNERVCCVEEDICDVHEADSGCGSRVTISESRIVGGQDALPGEWPWQAQLYYIPVGNEVCGGTLVGPRHVVSAAHCFDDPPYPDAWIVRLGRYTRGNPPSPADDESIEVGVQEIIRHNEFYGIQNNDNDIALIILDQDVSTTDFINYACLDDDVTFYEDSCCYITGWGTLEFLGDQPNILQEAVVSILSNDTCIASYWSPLVTENMVCAGYLTGGIDSCQGDSGGPLVCIHTDADTGISRWHLAGITSWGFGCAYPGYPGVYTRVSKYYGWLQDHGVPF